jgi:hypothetical protein
VSEQSPGRPAAPGDDGLSATEPALALGEVWDLLDALPSAAASADLSSTTLEMAAVPPAPPGGPLGWLRGGMRGGARGWLPAAAVAVAALAAGYATGWATGTDHDRRVLEHLAEVEHYDLLREAGSVGFLEQVAKRGYPPPRRFGPPPAGNEGIDDAREFDAALRALETRAAEESDSDAIEARRGAVVALGDDARRRLEKSVEAWRALPGSEQRELARLAKVLGDPRRDTVRKAARLWHQWVRGRDPADRRDVIDLGPAERIEWLERWTRIDARFDPQRPGFDRDWENRRRGILGQPGGPGGPGGQPGGMRPRFPGQGGPPGGPPPGRPAGTIDEGEPRSRPPFTPPPAAGERPPRPADRETPPPPR